MRRYWTLKEEVPDCILWRTHSGRGYEPGRIRDTDDIIRHTPGIS